MDQGTVRKILSLACYLLTANGQCFPGITTCQYIHTLPYEHGLSEGFYPDLFVLIGRNEPHDVEILCLTSWCCE